MAIVSTATECGMISIDWIATSDKPELVIEEIYAAGLSRDVAAHVQQIAGPSGNSIITLQGSKEVIRNFYVNTYMGGDPGSELDFAQFWKS
tara:strand:+ start:38 stop:310 length:273 start_codon:yes stop_codon:yes gene_type:complete